MKERTPVGLSVGGSSMMMIFVLLCLATFATLSVASAGADLKLTQKAVRSTEAYYAADEAAERRLAAIRLLLARTPPGEGAASNALQALRTRESDLELSLMDDTLMIRYAVPLSDIQELRVSVLVSFPETGSPALHRQEWSVYSTEEWESGEGPLKLWDGDAGGGLEPESSPGPRE